MSYTELESGYQDLRQSAQSNQPLGSHSHSHRVGFYLGQDGNGDTDFGDSNDGMDSDTSTSSSTSKQVIVGICAMAKKTQSKPMKEILTRLGEFEFIRLVTFEENVILREQVQNWPICDCLVSFHSKGFPLEKAIEYAQLRNPFVLNNLHMQYDIQDRRRVYAILEKEGIEIPRYAVLDRDSPDPKHHELIESEDHVEVNGITFNKPFVEKPVSAEDHNIYIYYPTSAGGGSQRLFRKIGSRSSVYSPESRVRKTGSFIYEDFMPTDGTDVKVYTVGPDYAHAEARKSPALDGKVERDSEGKEIRYPVILNHSEKLISRKVCLAFKQTVCGFDLLRANGKSYVCDVNGFSFVKNSNKYYDDCAKILGNMILRELTPTLHIPWSVPFQLDDPPIVPTTFGKMMELRCVVAIIRHGDRTPKQKMKVEVRHPNLHSTFRHDLKIYASDEGRVQMTAAAFAKGLLALEGELTPILVQMVKSANTNGLLDNDCDSSKYQNLAKGRLHELMQNDREFTQEDRVLINPCNSKSITQALDFVKNPVDCCHHVHLLIRELLHIISIKKDDPKTKDAILYHGETWDLMRCRWEKIEKDFSTKSKLFDISKIPDIYDCIKYDLQHNQHTLQYDQAEELYIYAKNLADIVIPQEYGLTPQEKLAIGQGICSPLLRKIKGDLQRNIDEIEDEFMNRLNPHYSHGVASPQRHVRTRLYFTSESHVHSLLTVLRYGGLLNVVTDEQWRRAMDYISMVTELNYMSQIVIMLYEDPTKDPTSEERFHVELHFSPGVNCCVQKNLPPGPGFRPHSHGDNSCNSSVQSNEESNPSRIEEENDTIPSEEQQGKMRSCPLSNARNTTGNSFGFNRLDLRSKQSKSKPIPIGAHHTVSGHEAMDLAKRLNEELASQQQQQQQQLLLHNQGNQGHHQHYQHHHQHQQQQLRPISPDIRAGSPDCEPRSRSYEQRGSPSASRDKEAASVSSVSANSSSTSSRRQRHSIAGQMSYMKMLGFGGFSKKMATSANSLFSTAVISGSSSAPNLRDMIPVSSSGFGDVPPIRPLETLHNALSLRKLDSFLQDMIAQISKTPTGSPPRVLGGATAVATNESIVVAPAPGVGQVISVSDITSNSMAADPEQKDARLTKRPNQNATGETSDYSGISESDPSGAARSSEPDEDVNDVAVQHVQQIATAQIQHVSDELHSFLPMNQDTLQLADGSIYLSVCDEFGPGSTSLTPVSTGLDIDLDLSMVANKGSMTLSIDGFEDDEEATPSTAMTPSLPVDVEPKLEMCYCCSAHAVAPPEVATDDPKYCFALPVHITQASPEHTRSSVRRTHDPISPRIQKQISMFEGAAISPEANGGAMHASINLPAVAYQLRQDARLRKFENLTQSTSTSNFPFESNTLKRAPLVSTKDDYANVSHTQSCINLKSSSDADSRAGSLRQHTTAANYNRPPNALSVCYSLDTDATICSTPTAGASGTAAGAAVGTAAGAGAGAADASPHPGALIVKERFIEPPMRGIVRGYHDKTQSMDADFLFNEFLLLPAIPPKVNDDQSKEQPSENVQMQNYEL
ncbi:GH24076 [Drosophila grimshawi]|uniref:Inositol hexakisphosphate and diphosphoinositol-pentakisphosphate kinase n=1 Tax=Drosophila grimshawi TaxID=7222 RepID=B4JNV3_DROGR|nr:GH24076 [Drosophila grimshawi]